ncbi:MAG: OmpH family outer membrane protein [Proteobacteria bacterium]|uniref:OmpH family outer membrane protein n=1 Tax=Rudaea sp. TaxID=2136325 RepID=UPI001D9A980B|nr:OmpH family outer membrane protein [Pseudomonadota bacterium]MBS0566638.1 OmpH family outer membrane protein [Pseudomonadota bacterium]
MIHSSGSSRRYARCALIAALVLSAPIRAQPPATAAAATPRIGYIDVKRLIDSAPQFVDARARLDREFARQDAAIKADDAKLAALKQRYERDSAIMTKDSAEALKREIEATERDNKRRRDEARAEYNNRGNEEVNRNLRLINDTAIEYARTQGYDMIVGSQAVLYASARMDITDAVLQRLKELNAGSAKP